jgi:hypothetical protein
MQMLGGEDYAHHRPLNLNPSTHTRLFFRWRGRPCVDASILARRKAVPPHLRDHEHVTFDHVEDEALRSVMGEL